MTIELEADLFDTLELTSYIYRGIGAERWDAEGVEPAPFCVGGHADFAHIDGADYLVLAEAFGGYVVNVNNEAVRRINRRKGKRNLNARVSWPEYTTELGIVRKAATL